MLVVSLICLGLFICVVWLHWMIFIIVVMCCIILFSSLSVLSGFSGEKMV